MLKLHRVQHYGAKCYKCTICDETFKSKKEMEAHIKGHANDVPDDEEENSNGGVTTEPGTVDKSNNVVIIQEIIEEDSIDLSSTTPPPPQSSSSTPSLVLEHIPTSSNSPNNLHVIPITPKESSSENNSDGDDVTYYNMYSRFEQSVVGGSTTSIGVNPALLAAASMAAASFDQHLSSSPSPPPSTSAGSSILSSSSSQQSTSMQPPSFIYEPLSVMRQHGYFGPTTSSQVDTYRPSSLESSNDLVRRVEAALAGTEPLLTPPRSSPESPDRSSSPETDLILMADRDNMSLPLRKRKLYLKDNSTVAAPSAVNTLQGKSEEKLSHINDGGSNSSSDCGSTGIRMSSVIQFAKAS